MFSSLPKLADRAFVVGYLLPTLLFVFALAALFADQPLVQKLVSSEAQGLDKIVGLVVTVWTAAVFLQFINTSLIKFLEGYAYPIKGWRNLRMQQEAAFDTFDCRLKELWNKINSRIPLSEAEAIEFQRKSIQFHRSFASTRFLLLPTAFGNSIRAFEQYGNEVYGADSVTLWSHLSTVISKDFASQIGDARAQVNGLLNIVYLSACFAIIALLRSAYSVVGLLSYDNAFRALHGQGLQIILFLLATVVSSVVTVASYTFAIRSVYVWGDYVKAAFDCYLPELAKKLGFRMPASSKQQKEMWEAISQRVAYHLPFEPELWMLAQQEAVVEAGKPPEAKPPAEGVARVSAADTNKTPAEKAVTESGEVTVLNEDDDEEEVNGSSTQEDSPEG